MKQLFLLVIAATLFQSCSKGQTHSTGRTKLSATEFSEKIKELPTATVIDVRTANEFSKGHLENALNYDWNGREFERQVASLDKTRPVLVYCLSGARSSSAASKMRSEGFETVYELNGGIMRWRSANLPETTNNTVPLKGMSKDQFDALLNSDKLVLIDFYADWCAPCKKMKPFLEEISTEMANKVVVIRINADENPSLFRELGIDSLPVLHLYKDKTLIWGHTGYLSKADIVKQLR